MFGKVSVEHFGIRPLSANTCETREEREIRVGRGREKQDGTGRRNEGKRNAPLFGGGQAKRGSFPAGSGGFGEGEEAAVHGGVQAVGRGEGGRLRDAGRDRELLRREGLYSSHLSSWRKAAREGSLRGLAKKRGPRSSGGKREARKVRKLERENARLREELCKARIIIDIQGKVAGLLGVSPGDGKRS